MRRTNKTAYIALFIIMVATIVVYSQTFNFGFINYDDPVYVVKNTHINTGLRPDNILWAFSAIVLGNWQPVTLLSHMLDCELFGLKAGGHHASSIIFHVVTAVLLFITLNKLTSCPWRSVCVTFLFALHPLRVESVAWISERKDVLSAMFFMLSLLGYVYYVRKPTLTTYLLTISSYAIGLMCKSMIVTLPFVLLLLDYWPLGRLAMGKVRMVTPSAGLYRASGCQPQPLSRLIIEKLPFFVLSGIISIVSVYAQKTDKALQSTLEFTLAQRLSNALTAYVTYLQKTFWPSDLAVLYPFLHSIPILIPIMAFFTLAGVTLLFVIYAQRKPYLLIGWFWYLGMLVPVIGFVQVGLQSMADRYTYLPSIGLAIAVVWGIAETVPKWHYRETALVCISAGVAATLLFVTNQQIKYWNNSVDLFTHAAHVTKGNYIALINLGDALEKNGKYLDALINYKQALSIKPDNAFAYFKIGNALQALSREDDSISFYGKSLQLDDTNAQAHSNMGISLITIGKTADAIIHFKRAIELDPDFSDAHFNLGLALESLGKIHEAVGEFYEALRINPTDSGIRYNLESALAKLRMK